MTALPAAERARPPALDAAVSTLEVPGLDEPYGMFVMADGNCLVTTSKHTLQLLTPHSGRQRGGWVCRRAGRGRAL